MRRQYAIAAAVYIFVGRRSIRPAGDAAGAACGPCKAGFLRGGRRAQRMLRSPAHRVPRASPTTKTHPVTHMGEAPSADRPERARRQDDAESGWRAIYPRHQHQKVVAELL